MNEPIEDVDIPAYIEEFGIRHGLPEFAKQTYVAGYKAALRKHRAAIAAMPGWRPIETAPKNVRILAYFPSKAAPWRAGWYAVHSGWSVQRGIEDWFLDDGESGVLNYDEPTHWQPLPQPPESTDE